MFSDLLSTCLFSVTITNRKHLMDTQGTDFWLERSSRVTPLHFCYRPGRRSDRDFVIITLTSPLSQKAVRSSGTSENNLQNTGVIFAKWNFLTSEKCLQSDAEVAPLPAGQAVQSHSLKFSLCEGTYVDISITSYILNIDRCIYLHPFFSPESAAKSYTVGVFKFSIRKFCLVFFFFFFNLIMMFFKVTFYDLTKGPEQSCCPIIKVYF